MPTLAVGMLEMREDYDMPTASVGMASFLNTPRNRNKVAYRRRDGKGRRYFPTNALT
jgi:hypothetical protein